MYGTRSAWDDRDNFQRDLAAELTDEASAQAVQLALEYAPAPPFEAGRPDLAPPEVLSRVRERSVTIRQCGLVMQSTLQYEGFNKGSITVPNRDFWL